MAYPTSGNSGGVEKKADLGATTLNPITNKLYNTISCPCSSYYISLGDGNVGCERDLFGTKKAVKPVFIKNHVIGNNYPKFGDKWLCTNLKCEDGDFKYDTLHVIGVEENLTGSSSSLFNSKISTLHCHVSGLAENFQDYIHPALQDGSGIMPVIPVPTSYVDGVAFFENHNDAFLYSAANSADNSVPLSFHTKDGVAGYLAIDYVVVDKRIMNITVNGKDILGEVMPDFKVFNNDEAAKTKTTFKPEGDFFNIKITGANKPTFTMSLKDSSGCDVLASKQKNISFSTVYNLEQEIPSLAIGETSEVYDLEITPSSDTNFGIGEDRTTGVVKMKIYQYKNPTYTFQAPDSTLASSTTVAPNIKFSGNSNSITSSTDGHTKQVHTATISHATFPIYCKRPMPSFFSLFSKNNMIKRTVVREDWTDSSKTNQIIVRSGLESASGVVVDNQGDIKRKMKFSSNVTKTKTIRKSIDLDIHKEPCDDCPETDIFTNKFEVDNTNDIFEGMKVTGKDFGGKEFITTLESIDCGKSITLINAYAIDVNTDITLKYDVNGEVMKVSDCSEGQILELSRGVRLPKGAEIFFENAAVSNIDGTCRCVNGITSNIVEVTTTIDEVRYGQEDVTFTLNLDDFVSYKPNDRDQYVTIGKNFQDFVPDFHAHGVDLNRSVRSITITRPPSNGIKYANDHAEFPGKYIPNPEFVGKDKIGFTSSFGGGVASDEKTIFITVKGVTASRVSKSGAPKTPSY